MYNRNNGKQRKRTPLPKLNKIMMLSIEKEEHNGKIINKSKYVLKEIKPDPNISYKDFDIDSLINAGIDPNSLKSTTLGTDRDTLANNAEEAQQIMEYSDIIKELEND